MERSGNPGASGERRDFPPALPIWNARVRGMSASMPPPVTDSEPSPRHPGKCNARRDNQCMSVVMMGVAKIGEDTGCPSRMIQAGTLRPRGRPATG